MTKRRESTRKNKDDAIESIISFRDFFRIFLKVIYAMRKILTALFSFIIGIGILVGYIEHIGFWNGIYLAFVSALTVGYGDLTPKTAIGKFLCVGVLPIIGMLLTGIMVAGAIKAIEIGNEDMKRKKSSKAERPNFVSPALVKKKDK